MNVITEQRIAVIHSDTAKDFELELNKRLQELSKFSPEVKFNMNMGHCAYLYYTYEEEIPEDVKDEYELRGEQYYCGDCPELKKTKDKRRKWFPCGYHPYGKSNIESKACAHFYEELVKREEGQRGH